MSVSARMYLGTNNGVVTLAKNGEWSVESRGLQGWSIPRIAVDPTAPNRLFAGTLGNGVWLSEDAGKSWDKPSYGKKGPGKVRGMTLHPDDPNTIYVGNEPIDLYMSKDAGETWTTFDSIWSIPSVESVVFPSRAIEPHLRDIVIKPDDPNTMYVALQVGYMLKSEDGGATWRLLDKGLDADVHSIAMNPTNTSEMVIATGGYQSRGGKVAGRALYRSEDAGESWSPTAMDFPHTYSDPLIRHPQNPQILFASLGLGEPPEWSRPSGAETIFVRSEDGGRSWEAIEGAMPTDGKLFLGALDLDEQDNDRLYGAMRGGDMITSTNGGTTWDSLGVDVPPVNHMKLARA
jgi:photosystem II stability/assembly factor-like uncharacterized protein